MAAQRIDWDPAELEPSPVLTSSADSCSSGCGTVAVSSALGLTLAFEVVILKAAGQAQGGTRRASWSKTQES